MWTWLVRITRAYGYASVVALSCVILVVAGLTSTTPKNSPPSINSSNGIDDVRAYWGGEIVRKGAEKAYADFKDFYSTAPTNAHLAAHVMGALLYAKSGLPGLSICDDSFGNGCYHALLTKALVDRGMDVLGEVASACELGTTWRSSSCIHGVGHGVLEYLGPDELGKALEICTSVFPEGKADRCAVGVFMDYTTPLDDESSGTQLKRRPIDPRHPYSPCDTESVPASMRNECYFVLPQHWWDRVGGLEEVDALCAKAAKAYQKACYSGIGIQLPGEVLYDESLIISQCRSLSTVDGIKSCLLVSAGTQEQFGRDFCGIYAELGVAKEHGC